MNIYDGSGLSLFTNRIATLTMARILQSLKKETWFESYYNSIPQYNNMKMKSGTISDVIAMPDTILQPMEPLWYFHL